MSAPELILASGSSYRRQQLERLGLHCRAQAPNIDESRLPGEAPAAMARRLAALKAGTVVAQARGACVIAADQVAACESRVLGKPGSAAAQSEQLLFCSGKELRFHTALTVIDASGTAHEHLDLTVCQVRELTAAEVERYVAAEPAYDCAGGFKVEGLGITLFERIESEDPSALIGLPLLALCRILRQLGVAAF
ncbi:MAG: nucleoside triphosphate pyrophosphatase [Lysobacterales bacterium]